MAQQSETTQSLKKLLASSYTLYLKTQKFHWNVTGPMFTTLHTLFETQYQDLALAVDEIAERIRALGEYAPGSFNDFSKLSVVGESTDYPKAEVMIQSLLEDQSLIVSIAKELVSGAEADGDVVTSDLATRRMEVHEKNAWMLRSHIES